MLKPPTNRRMTNLQQAYLCNQLGAVLTNKIDEIVDKYEKLSGTQIHVNRDNLPEKPLYVQVTARLPLVRRHFDAATITANLSTVVEVGSDKQGNTKHHTTVRLNTPENSGHDGSWMLTQAGHNAVRQTQQDAEVIRLAVYNKVKEFLALYRRTTAELLFGQREVSDLLEALANFEV